ncbi:MAG: hypothetical protein JWP97_3890 [Labilithrix sp.]|nr:hypothetical protein [Labilithrix sp.]
MGYDLLAAVSFILLTPVVIVGFIAYWIVNARDHEELAGVWASYARARGITFEPPGGEWPNRTAPTLRWKIGRAELLLVVVGRESKVHTRLVVRPRSPLLGTLVWAAFGPGSGEIRQREHPRAFGARLVDERVHRALLSLRQRDRVSLAYRRGRVVVDWPGGERSDARLDAARTLGAELLRAIDEQYNAPARVADKPAA